MKTDPFHINDIFTISSDQEFNDKAIQIFHHQTKHCKPYKTFLDLVNIVPVARIADNRNKLHILTQRDAVF